MEIEWYHRQWSKLDMDLSGENICLFLRTVELISVKIIFNLKYKFMHVAMVFKEFNWRVYLKDSSLNWNNLKFACAVIADKHYKLLSPKISEN